jgi:hypothetical protein
MRKALASMGAPDFPQLADRRCPTSGPADDRIGLGVWRPLSLRRVEALGAAAHCREDRDQDDHVAE